tara:strand:- start:553 stop:891 length:339 start_codon:yes stop_codon:yes gene_type:complete
MGIRYDNRVVAVNNEELYEELFDARGVRYIAQYLTPSMRYPTPEEMSKLKIFGHIWKQGDRFYKVANKYYGDPKMWWIISWFNKKPLESDIKLGDKINIPMPMEEVLRIFNS